MMHVCMNICYSNSPEYAATSSEMLPEACKNTDKADDEQVPPTQTQSEEHRSNVKKTRTSTPSTPNKLVLKKYLYTSYICSLYLLKVYAESCQLNIYDSIFL